MSKLASSCFINSTHIYQKRENSNVENLFILFKKKKTLKFISISDLKNVWQGWQYQFVGLILKSQSKGFWINFVSLVHSGP